MSWHLDREVKDHEYGYLVAVERTSGGAFKDVDFDRYDGEAPAGGFPDVAALQATCVCGWRSSRWTAPSGARYRPWMVVVPDDHDERGAGLWAEHIAAVERQRPR